MGQGVTDVRLGTSALLCLRQHSWNLFYFSHPELCSNFFFFFCPCYTSLVLKPRFRLQSVLYPYFIVGNTPLPFIYIYIKKHPQSHINVSNIYMIF